MIKYNELLPDFSFAYLNTTGEVILIKKGEKGFYPQPHYEGKSVDELNESIDVTKAQAEAMVSGSMFGWDIPASNPQLYEERMAHDESKYSHNKFPEWKSKKG